MGMCAWMLRACVLGCYGHVCLHVMGMCAWMLRACVLACYGHVWLDVTGMCACLLRACVLACYGHVCLHVNRICHIFGSLCILIGALGRVGKVSILIRGYTNTNKISAPNLGINSGRLIKIYNWCFGATVDLQKLWPIIILKILFLITQHMVPNIEYAQSRKFKTRNHPRHGIQCVIEYPRNRNPAQSFKKMQ